MVKSVHNGTIFGFKKWCNECSTLTLFSQVQRTKEVEMLGGVSKYLLVLIKNFFCTR